MLSSLVWRRAGGCSAGHECAGQGNAVHHRGVQPDLTPLQYADEEQQSTEILLEKNNAAEGIDVLHECVLRAREEKKAGSVPPDAWKPNLDPRIAVRARTIPMLDRELERLQQEYEQVTWFSAK